MNGDGSGEALGAAAKFAAAWLDSVPERRVPASATIDEVLADLTTELPGEPSTPPQVIEELQHACDPGLTAMPSGRFFGFVIGGTHPAALAADWLVSAWDQNAGMRLVTPATSAVEELAARWILDLLRLPDDAGVGFVTGPPQPTSRASRPHGTRSYGRATGTWVHGASPVALPSACSRARRRT